MEIDIQLTSEPVPENISPACRGRAGAWAEFRGIVRGEENGAPIDALEYEAYAGMARLEIHRLLQDISTRHPCLAVTVIHRLGTIPVGETAIYIGVAASHRAPAFALLAEFMDRLKKDVPVWKRQALPAPDAAKPPGPPPLPPKTLSLDLAISEIQSRCQPLPGIRVSLPEATGRVLRETVFAPEDFPACDRSTRDGYAILGNDNSAAFLVVDTLHAADWKLRQLKNGEAVRVATGAALPCENLRVIMQENAERSGDMLKIVHSEDAANVRRRGEEMHAGNQVFAMGRKLDAGALALLASVGCTRPLVSPRLRVAHFTTGDEIISPEQAPQPGQIRDSNSILIRASLEKFSCDVSHWHLPENFVASKQLISALTPPAASFDLILVSGGASVGEKDFTRPLLEWLGFEIIFNRLNLRPGAPLIFGVNGNRTGFGLPGNPLSHLVCFQLFVTAALTKLTGGNPRHFSRGVLKNKLEDAPNPRETLWPAKIQLQDGACWLDPLRWSSSGDMLALAEANALIRYPANCAGLKQGMEVEFFPTDFSGL